MRTTIWIDHKKAYIFHYLADGIHRSEIVSHEEKTDKEHLKKFYHQVASELTKSDCLLVTGPGMAKEEFRNHCEDHHPQLAKAIVEVKTMKGHASFEEILQVSNKFFAKYNDWAGVG